MRAHLFDAGAVDLLDLAHEQVERDRPAQDDGELVDRDLVAALEHVDPDDVAVERADARGDEAERTGTVGEPDPHEDVRRWIRDFRSPHERTSEDDANVSRE